MAWDNEPTPFRTAVGHEGRRLKALSPDAKRHLSLVAEHTPHPGAERYLSLGPEAEDRRTPCRPSVWPQTCFCVLALLFLQAALLSAVSFAAQSEPLLGKASWYGTSAHGKKTASGELFNRYSMMAAHRTLPFGTVLRVYNLRNHRQVLVRVADRGPFVDGRIVDVSMRAAERLKMRKSGIVRVAVEVVGNAKGEPLNPESAFYLHIANEKILYKALALAAQLNKSLNMPTRTLFSVQGTHPTHAVCLGPYSNFIEAERVLFAMENKKIPTLGIIEAPAKGGDIPRHVPPVRQSAGKTPAKKRVLKTPNRDN